MEQSAAKYLTIASVFGIHLVRTQNRLQRALRLIYSFLMCLAFAPLNLYFIYKQYLDILESHVSGGLITVYLFIMIYNFSLGVQLLVSFYWLLTKSHDFSQLLQQVDRFANELACEELLANHVKRLDAIFCFLVFPALCILTISDLCTYDTSDYQIFQLIESCYGCAIVAIWQWKIIFVVSSMSVVISKLNTSLKVPIYFLIQIHF